MKLTKAELAILKYLRNFNMTVKDSVIGTRAGNQPAKTAKEWTFKNIQSLLKKGYVISGYSWETGSYMITNEGRFLIKDIKKQEQGQ